MKQTITQTDLMNDAITNELGLMPAVIIFHKTGIGLEFQAKPIIDGNSNLTYTELKKFGFCGLKDWLMLETYGSDEQ